MEHGANVNKEDKEQNTVLAMAFKSGNEALIKYIIEQYLNSYPPPPPPPPKDPTPKTIHHGNSNNNNSKGKKIDDLYEKFYEAYYDIRTGVINFDRISLSSITEILERNTAKKVKILN